VHLHFPRVVSAARKSRCTCFLLRRLTRRVTQVYDAALLPAGLTITQYSLLAHLLRLPGLSASALAGHMGMDRTTLLRTLRPVIDAGWVRQGNGSPGRPAKLALSAPGAAKLREARPLWEKAQRSIEGAIGDRRVATLHALIDASLAALREDAST
jgi:DNA-binding MarR family transcriptional regulator